MRLDRPTRAAGCLVLFAAALAGPACSCGNRCSGVTCATAEACDPADGLCKCGGEQGSGTGAGGVVCGAGESCNPTLQSCVGTKCDGVACQNGNACDPQDGQCKCGGSVCAADALCDPNTHLCQGFASCQGVICPGGTSCDPLDGTCKCGAAACGVGQACFDGGCAADPCFGVNCSGAPGNACYGGICRCGGLDGPVCDTGQICLAASKTCQPAALCAGTSCGPGAICGPQDGLCHCGGLGGPVCAGGSACILDGPDAGDGGMGRCLGGNLCAGVTCPVGESCDETSGACLCGSDAGVQGFACGPTEVCGALPGAGGPSCLFPCDPYAQPPFVQATACPLADGGAPDAAGIPQACYVVDGLQIPVCQPAGKGTDGDPCAQQDDCGAGFGCFPPPDSSDGGGPQCWAYCDTFRAGPHGCQVIGRSCVPQAVLPVGDGGVLAIGACEANP